MSQITSDPKNISQVDLDQVLLLLSSDDFKEKIVDSILPPEKKNKTDSPSAELPSLPEGSLAKSGFALEIILQAIGETVRKGEMEAGMSQIKANADKRAEVNKENLKKIEENIEKLEKQSFWDKLSKAFSWIAVIAAVVVSAALVATGAGALAVAGLVVACVSLANQIGDAVGQSVSGEGWGLTSLMAKGLGKIFGEDAEKWIKFSLDLALTAASLVLSLMSNPVQATKDISKMISIVTKVAQAIQAGSQIVASGANIASGVYGYQVASNTADQKKLQAILQELQELTKLIEEHLKKELESGQKITESANEIVKEKNATITSIMTDGAASGGMA